MTTDLASTYRTTLSTLFAERMRIKGATLEQQVYKAAPRLPRHVRKSAKAVLTALTLAENPKLARQLDEKALRKAGDEVIKHLETIDPWDLFVGKMLKWLGILSAIVIVCFVVWVWYARKEGWV